MLTGGDQWDAMLNGGKALSFSFSKKADPKKVVPALVKKKEEDNREVITGLEAGEVKIDGPAKAATLLTIPCKNPLEEKEVKKRAAPAAPLLPKPSATGEPVEEPGGLVKRDFSQLSAEDAEAMKELLKDAENPDGTGAKSGMKAIPILMRDGSKQARTGTGAEASKDMFERIPVEAFGEALLRGMGYDPEKHQTKPVYHDKMRDGYLGLGAKALSPTEKLLLAKKKEKEGPAAAKAAAAKPAASQPGTQAASQAKKQPLILGAPLPPPESGNLRERSRSRSGPR